jgi:glucose-6-phosphate isomerase
METACLRLGSGLTFNYANMFGPSRIDRADLAELGGRIAAAHVAVCNMRNTGEVRGHLSKDGAPEKVLFTQLPFVAGGNLNSPESIARLKTFGQSLRHNTDAVIHFGIGGSYLGNKVIFDAHCGDYWNAKSPTDRDGYPRLYFSGNNIDPRRTADLINHIIAQAGLKAMPGDGEPYRVLLIVTSKSGATIDTMSAFMAVYDALRTKGPELEVAVVAVTDQTPGPKATLLKKLADAKGWNTFAVPDGIGGRFSVFSEVGLVTAACVGFDIDGFLAGAGAMDEACRTDDVWRNPAMLNAALKYIAAEKYGYRTEVFMPYGDYLKSLAEWYVQLLAESLGKRFDRSGREVFYGRTPIVAVGTTDMHAQTQQHQDGCRDKLVQFVKVGSWPEDMAIPDIFPEVPELSRISSINMSQALDVALEANAQALSGDNRPNAAFVLPRLNAYHLGELMYLLALSVAYEGELADVDAFDQPGVEAYKRIMAPKLLALRK